MLTEWWKMGDDERSWQTENASRWETLGGWSLEILENWLSDWMALLADSLTG